MAAPPASPSARSARKGPTDRDALVVRRYPSPSARKTPEARPSQKRWPRAWTPRRLSSPLPQPTTPSSHSLRLSSPKHTQLVRPFVSLSPLLLLLPPPPPPVQDARAHARSSNAHGRADGRAAHDRRPRRPPPPRLLLRLLLLSQEPQTLVVCAACCAVAEVRGGGAGGGGAAAGGAAAAGRAGGGRRAGDHRGPHRRAAAPGHHGRPLRVHALGGLPRLAVAPRPHRAGRDHRAQEAGPPGRRRHPRRGRRRGLLRPAPAPRRQVPHRDQDRRAQRGEEEAGEGGVPGPALQRGVDPAGPGRDGVRGRRAQHLAPHRQAVPGPAPVRGGGHHGALGGGGGAGAGDAEGERDGQEPAHRAQHHQRAALHLADPHGARDRRQGLRVHQLAMSSSQPRQRIGPPAPLFDSSLCLSLSITHQMIVTS